MDDGQILTRVKALVEPIIRSEGMELVDLEYHRESRGRVLRLFIDRDGGVTLDDCASISQEVDRNLEVEGIPPGAYTLEVSSPGLNRRLKTETDFHRFRSRKVKIRTSVPIGDRRTFTGTLLGCRDGLIEIEGEGHVIQIPLGQIVRANLVYEF